MALVAHTFRISAETLADLKRLGKGNESKGARIALERSGRRALWSFIGGLMAGVSSTLLMLYLLR